MVRSTTRGAGDPGSNAALGKQWSRDYPIDVPATPMLPNTNLRYQEALRASTCASGPKEDVASFFCPRSFDRAVMLLKKHARDFLAVSGSDLGLELTTSSL